MDVCFHVSNTKSLKYPIIMVRKFFQMVFIGNDRKSLNIYTATILSGCKECTNINNYKSFSTDEQSINYGNDFKISFKFTSNDNGFHAKTFNLTNNFLEQSEKMLEVWGEFTNLPDQDKVKQKLEYLFTGISIKDDLNAPAVCIEQEKEEDKKKQFISIVISGELNGDNSEYVISAPSKLHQGIELVNWVKTTIVFNNPIKQRDLNYSIKFDSNGTNYLTPDFTLYFAPPTRTEIDYSSATVALNKKSSQPNSISPVANKTTINFKEWVNDERITSRNKCRLTVLKNVDSPITSVKATFNITKKIENAIRQFLFGILASSIIAFGIDYTRLSKFENMFPLNPIMPTDIAYVINAVVCFLVFVTKPPEYCESSNLANIWKCLGLGVFVVWFLALFWVAGVMFKGYDLQVTCKTLYSLTLLINVGYLLFYLKKYGYEMFIDFFR